MSFHYVPMFRHYPSQAYHPVALLTSDACIWCFCAQSGLPLLLSSRDIEGRGAQGHNLTETHMDMGQIMYRKKRDYQIINTKTCRLCILCILQVIYNVDISIEHIYHDIIYMDISIVKHLIWYEYIINTLTVLVSPGCLARRKVARDRSENQFLKAQT